MCRKQKAAQLHRLINENSVFEVIVVDIQTFCNAMFYTKARPDRNVAILTNSEAMLMNVEHAIESCTFVNLGNHNRG
jgi:hypothetical protein